MRTLTATLARRASPRTLALMFLIAYGVIGGATFSVSKLAMMAGVHPFGYTLWQVGGAGLVVWLLSLWRGHSIPLNGPHIRFYAVCGVVGIALPSVVMFTTIVHLPAGILAIVMATIPIFTYALTLILRMEAFRWIRVAGIMTGFLGAMLILLPKASLPSPDMTFWAVLAFLVPLFYAIGSTYTGRHRPPQTRAPSLTVGMLAAATMVILPVALVRGDTYLPRFPMGQAEFAIMAQIAISSVGYMLFFEIIRLAGPVFFSQVGYFVTIAGVSWGAWIFGESHTGWVWAAALLILVGLTLVNIRPPAQSDR